LSSRRLHKVHNTAAPRRVLLFLLFLLFFAAEILGCRGFGDLRKQPDQLGDAGVLRC
jgi:hypothetical protein